MHDFIELQQPFKIGFYLEIKDLIVNESKKFPKLANQIRVLNSDLGCLAPTLVILKRLWIASNSLFCLMHSFCYIHILTSTHAHISKPCL